MDALELDPQHQLKNEVTDTADKADEDDTMRRRDAAYRKQQQQVAKMRADLRKRARDRAQAVRERGGNPDLEEIAEQMQSGGGRAPSFLEVGSTQYPYHVPLAVGTVQTPAVPFDRNQPGYRSYTRAVERQKFSEIYHMADMVLDRVCEASMPNDFYPVCTEIFKAQGAIANLLSRQTGVSTVCQRLNFCGSTSYVSTGIHTPRPRPRKIGSDPENPNPDVNDVDDEAETVQSLW